MQNQKSVNSQIESIYKLVHYKATNSMSNSESTPTNFGHLGKFLKVASDKIKKRQLVKVLCSLICHFYYLLNKMQKKINETTEV